MSAKESNEITVKITCELPEFYALLENKGFTPADRFSLDDSYFIPNALNMKDMTVRELLSKAVLVREIRDQVTNRIINRITYKTKEFGASGEILRQTAINCEIVNAKDAEKLLSALGYRELMRIFEDDVVYEKDGFELAVKDIHGGDKLIEIETEPDSGELDTIEKLKQKLLSLHLPIDQSDFFVKKAEVELDQILRDNGRNA
jgi:predicted adenylyl cyclase CyaB